jgi:hypothetical protein
MFKPGMSGNPKGRPAGSKNEKRYEVRKILEEHGCDPFAELAKLAMNARSEKVRCEAAAELAQYIAPKLKSIEHRGDNFSPINHIINLG